MCRALNCGFRGYRFESYYLPRIVRLKLNIIDNLIIKQNVKKSFLLFYFFYNYKKNKIKKFNLNFFYNFFFKYIYLLNKVYNFKKLVMFDYLLTLNLQNKQVKLNCIDIINNKNYIYSIGLILKLLNIFKKSNRRNVTYLKYIINYVFKLYSLKFINSKLILSFKGLFKNYVKLIYFFRLLINKYNISLFLINPIKINNMSFVQKKRSIKRRIYKKLVVFNKN